MHIDQVDERDTHWERQPHLRVFVYGRDEQGQPTSTETFDIEGADALQAIDWAQRSAGPQRLWALATVSEMPAVATSGQRGITWLVGADPHAQGLTSADNADAVQRMYARAGQLIILPTSDRNSVSAPVDQLDDPPRRPALMRLTVAIVALLLTVLGAYVASINLAVWIGRRANASMQHAVDQGGKMLNVPCPSCDSAASFSFPGLLVFGLAVITAAVGCAIVAQFVRSIPLKGNA